MNSKIKKIFALILSFSLILFSQNISFSRYLFADEMSDSDHGSAFVASEDNEVAEVVSPDENKLEKELPVLDDSAVVEKPATDSNDVVSTPEAEGGLTRNKRDVDTQPATQSKVNITLKNEGHNLDFAKVSKDNNVKITLIGRDGSGSEQVNESINFTDFNTQEITLDREKVKLAKSWRAKVEPSMGVLFTTRAAVQNDPDLGEIQSVTVTYSQIANTSVTTKWTGGDASARKTPVEIKFGSLPAVNLSMADETNVYVNGPVNTSRDKTLGQITASRLKINTPDELENFKLTLDDKTTGTKEIDGVMYNYAITGDAVSGYNVAMSVPSGKHKVIINYYKSRKEAKQELEIDDNQTLDDKLPSSEEEYPMPGYNFAKVTPTKWVDQDGTVYTTEELKKLPITKDLTLKVKQCTRRITLDLHLFDPEDPSDQFENISGEKIYARVLENGRYKEGFVEMGTMSPLQVSQITPEKTPDKPVAYAFSRTEMTFDHFNEAGEPMKYVLHDNKILEKNSHAGMWYGLNSFNDYNGGKIYKSFYFPPFYNAEFKDRATDKEYTLRIHGTYYKSDGTKVDFDKTKTLTGTFNDKPEKLTTSTEDKEAYDALRSLLAVSFSTRTDNFDSDGKMMKIWGVNSRAYEFSDVEGYQKDTVLDFKYQKGANQTTIKAVYTPKIKLNFKYTDPAEEKTITLDGLLGQKIKDVKDFNTVVEPKLTKGKLRSYEWKMTAPVSKRAYDPKNIGEFAPFDVSGDKAREYTFESVIDAYMVDDAPETVPALPTIQDKDIPNGTPTPVITATNSHKTVKEEQPVDGTTTLNVKPGKTDFAFKNDDVIKVTIKNSEEEEGTTKTYTIGKDGVDLDNGAINIDLGSELKNGTIIEVTATQSPRTESLVAKTNVVVNEKTANEAIEKVGDLDPELETDKAVQEKKDALEKLLKSDDKTQKEIDKLTKELEDAIAAKEAFDSKTPTPTLETSNKARTISEDGNTVNGYTELVVKPGYKKLPFKDGDTVKVVLVKEGGEETLTFKVGESEQVTKNNDGSLSINLGDELANGTELKVKATQDNRTESDEVTTNVVVNDDEAKKLKDLVPAELNPDKETDEAVRQAKEELEKVLGNDKRSQKDVDDATDKLREALKQKDIVDNRTVTAKINLTNEHYTIGKDNEVINGGTILKAYPGNEAEPFKTGDTLTVKVLEGDEQISETTYTVGDDNVTVGEDGSLTINLGGDLKNGSTVEVVAKQGTKTPSLPATGKVTVNKEQAKKVKVTVPEELDENIPVDKAVIDAQKNLEDVLNNEKATQKEIDEATKKLEETLKNKTDYDNSSRVPEVELTNKSYMTTDDGESKDGYTELVVTSSDGSNLQEGDRILVEIGDMTEEFTVGENLEVKDNKVYINLGNELENGTILKVRLQQKDKNISEPVEATVTTNDDLAKETLNRVPENLDANRTEDKELIDLRDELTLILNTPNRTQKELDEATKKLIDALNNWKEAEVTSSTEEETSSITTSSSTETSSESKVTKITKKEMKKGKVQKKIAKTGENSNYEMMAIILLLVSSVVLAKKRLTKEE